MSKFVSKTEKGFKCLNFGTTATGKTSSIATLLLAGQKVRFLSADNNAEAGINAGLKLYNITPEEDQLSIHIPERQQPEEEDILANIKNMLNSDFDVYLKGKDKSRKKQQGFLNIYSSAVNFSDSKSGKDYGAVKDWGTDTTFIIDSLTVVCNEIRLTVCGMQPPSQPQYGAMQGFLTNFVNHITNLGCNVVLLGHPTKETDEVTGATRIYPLNIGKALNEQFASNFSDVLYSQFDGKKYFWSTSHRTAVCSGRNIQISTELPQDFRQFFDKVD